MLAKASLHNSEVLTLIGVTPKSFVGGLLGSCMITAQQRARLDLWHVHCRSMYECVYASLTGTELRSSTPCLALPTESTKQKEAAVSKPRSLVQQLQHWRW